LWFLVRLPSPADSSQVRSFDIYEAVLDHGVSSPEEFESYQTERGRQA
jgi:hypothetical protein